MYTLQTTYFENSVNALIKGTPSEIASRDRLAAKPYLSEPEASVINNPVTTIDKAHTMSNIFLLDNFINKLYHLS